MSSERSEHWGNNPVNLLLYPGKVLEFCQLLVCGNPASWLWWTSEGFHTKVLVWTESTDSAKSLPCIETQLGKYRQKINLGPKCERWLSSTYPCRISVWFWQRQDVCEGYIRMGAVMTDAGVDVFAKHPLKWHLEVWDHTPVMKSVSSQGRGTSALVAQLPGAPGGWDILKVLRNFCGGFRRLKEGVGRNHCQYNWRVYPKLCW